MQRQRRVRGPRPYDYEQCAMAQIGGPCQSAAAACAGSSDCKAYQSCVGACTTDTACEACSESRAALRAQMLYYALSRPPHRPDLPLALLAAAGPLIRQISIRKRGQERPIATQTSTVTMRTTRCDT